MRAPSDNRRATMRPRPQAADQNQDIGSADCAGLPPTASATLYSAWVAEPEAATGAPPPDAVQAPSDIVIPGPSKYVLLLKGRFAAKLVKRHMMPSLSK